MSNHNTTTHHGDAQDKYNIAFGAIEPELKKLAAYLRKMFPKINSKGLLRILGFVNAWLGSKSNNIHPVLGSLLTQTTKIIDDAFLDDSGHSETKDHEEQTAKIIDDWTKKIFDDAVEQIRQSDDPLVTAEKIKKQATAIMSVLQEIERLKTEHKNQNAPADHAPKPDDEDSLFEILDRVGSGIVRFFKGARRPFLLYTGVVVSTILIAFASAVVVMMGLANGSQTMIFNGGIVLLIDIIVVAVVLLPAALGVNILGAISAKIFGGSNQ